MLDTTASDRVASTIVVLAVRQAATPTQSEGVVGASPSINGWLCATAYRSWTMSEPSALTIAIIISAPLMPPAAGSARPNPNQPLVVPYSMAKERLRREPTRGLLLLGEDGTGTIDQ